MFLLASGSSNRLEKLGGRHCSPRWAFSRAFSGTGVAAGPAVAGTPTTPTGTSHGFCKARGYMPCLRHPPQWHRQDRASTTRVTEEMQRHTETYYDARAKRRERASSWVPIHSAACGLRAERQHCDGDRCGGRGNSFRRTERSSTTTARQGTCHGSPGLAISVRRWVYRPGRRSPCGDAMWRQAGRAWTRWIARSATMSTTARSSAKGIVSGVRAPHGRSWDWRC